MTPEKVCYYNRSDLAGISFPKFLEYKNNGNLCDVVLKVGENKQIHCHRIILSAAVPFFHAMFMNDFREKKESTVELKGIDSEVLEELVNLCYGTKIEINYGNAEKILSGADFLELKELKSTVAKFLKSHLNPQNVLFLKKIGERYRCESLVLAAEEFIDRNFVEFTKTDQFMELEKSEFISLIERDELRVAEEDVYEAVLKWIKYAAPDRMTDFSELLSNVRLGLLSSKFLFEVVSKENLIQSSHECRNLLQEATFSRLMSDNIELSKSIRNRPRNSNFGKIYVMGGENTEGFLSDIQVYDPQKNEWHFETRLNNRIDLAASVVFQNNLYVIGGHNEDGGRAITTTDVFDFNNMSSTYARCMNWPTSSAAAVTIEDCIVVCGGLVSGRDEGSTLVQCYMTKFNKWTDLCPLNQKRSGHGAVTLDGLIYVIGGYENSTTTSSCERYDKKSNTWVYIPEMLTQRSFAGVAVLNKKIYVTGGETLTIGYPTNTVEVFDPVTGSWSFVAPMNKKRSRHALVSCNEKLYAIGGCDWSAENYLDTCEMYDPDKNTWTFVANLLEPTCEMSYGFIRN